MWTTSKQIAQKIESFQEDHGSGWILWCVVILLLQVLEGGEIEPFPLRGGYLPQRNLGVETAHILIISRISKNLSANHAEGVEWRDEENKPTIVYKF